MKPLILFYSYGGNTRKIAEMIQKQIGGVLAEIETEQPYPSDYKAVVEQGKQEVDADFEPSIKAIDVNIDDYDTVIIGTPVWWYTFAPPIKTVLSNQSWAGKTVYGFATHGGGPGQTLQNIQKVCTKADVREGIDIYFSSASLRKSKAEINAWIDTIY